MLIFLLMGLGAIILAVAQVSISMALKLAGGLVFALVVWTIAESIHMMNGDDNGPT